MALVYKHIRKDTNEIFYIGLGKNKYRINSKSGRNQYWHNIVNKVGYITEIIKEDMNWEDAVKEEIRLIKKYGRKDIGTGILVNMTDGGEGFVGKHSDVSKMKMSESKTGENHWIFGKQHSSGTKNKIGTSNKGKIRTDEMKEHQRVVHLGKTATDETKQKMSNSQMGRKHSDETKQKLRKPKTKKHRENISKGRIGMEFTPEHILNLRKSHIGQVNWNKGGSVNNIVRKKISETLKGNQNAKRIIVEQYTINNEYIKTWNSVKDIVDELKISRGNLTSCYTGKRKTAGGYIWKKIN